MDPSYRLKMAVFKVALQLKRLQKPTTGTEHMQWLGGGQPDETPMGDSTLGEWRMFLDRRPTPAGSDYRGAVTYATAPRDLKVFVYARADTTERAPMVLFVHGGGWQELHPFVHIRHCAELAARGYVTATAEYRLFPEARWPAMLNDARGALHWLRANASTLGGDPDRIAVAGGSAGGQLSALLALTDPGVQAAVLWYPMTDMRAPGVGDRSLHDAIGMVLGDASDQAKVGASPLTYVHPGAPPIMTVTGDVDDLTTVGMIRDFHAALDRAGVTNRLDVLEGMAHAFDFDPRVWPDSTDRLTAWLAEHLPI